jgi:putative hemolysin
MRLNQLSDLMSAASEKKGIEFIDQLFQQLRITYEIAPEELNRIPKDGAFIVVANHPFGGLDDLILLRMFSRQRPDFRIFSNPVLEKFPGLNEFFLPGTAFSSFGKHRSTPEQLLTVAHYLQGGGCLGIFPSGKVSGYDLNSNDYTDKEWGMDVLKFIRNARVPVIPVYFKGSSSLFCQVLGFIHPRLQKLRLPAEILNKKHSSIVFRIGNPISVKDQLEFTDIARFGRFLRAKTYALGTPLEVRKFFTPVDEYLPVAETIAPPVPVEILQQEIGNLRQERLLFESAPFRVYCAPADEIPEIIHEIGRLREVTFRLAGEGTNKKIDLDEYDIYYRHLFIWDMENYKIVGAYRIGMGKEILERYGLKGFYIYSLWRISEGFKPVLGTSMELGRSWIAAEYQRKPLSLYCLWKGILYFLLKHPDYRYLIGPVSISNRFSACSRSLMIEYLMIHHFDHELAKFVHPRNAFHSEIGKLDAEILIEGSRDLSKLDKMIRDMESDDVGIPVLLKKYLGLNGRIIAFNLDPAFNDVLDGLLLLDLMKVPMQVINTLSKEIDDSTILERFNAGANVMHRQYGVSDV